MGCLNIPLRILLRGQVIIELCLFCLAHSILFFKKHVLLVLIIHSEYSSLSWLGQTLRLDLPPD